MVLNFILQFPERPGVLIKDVNDAQAHAHNKILNLTITDEKNKHATEIQGIELYVSQALAPLFTTISTTFLFLKSIAVPWNWKIKGNLLIFS